MSYQRGSNDNEMSHAIHKEYTTIDILKFLLSILVVSIHTHPFEYRSSIADLIVSNVFARLAVPFSLYQLAFSYMINRQLVMLNIGRECFGFM